MDTPSNMDIRKHDWEKLPGYSVPEDDQVDSGVRVLLASRIGLTVAQ